MYEPLLYHDSLPALYQGKILCYEAFHSTSSEFTDKEKKAEITGEGSVATVTLDKGNLYGVMF